MTILWRELSPEAQQWRERYARFAREVIEPQFMRFDRENRFPDTIHEAAHAQGLMNRDFPEALGGGGMDDLAAAAGAEALASVCAPTAFTLGFNRGALHPVLYAGNDEQKAVFIRDLLQRRQYASLCLTEEEVSGSNLMGLQTTAEKTDRGWVIRGKKVMVGNAGVASLYITLARTMVNGQSRGLSFFAIPRDESVQVGPNIDKVGFRAVETPEVTFQDTEVSDFHLLGQPGAGAEQMFETLAAIRVGGSAVILGIVVGALRDALPWLEQRQVFGGPLIQKSHVQLLLGTIYGKLRSARLMVLRAAQRRRDGLPYAEAASSAKLQAAELAIYATSELSQLFGWRGIDNAYAIQKRMRDARQTTIFEGTSEMQKIALFRSLWSSFRAEGEF